MVAGDQAFLHLIADTISSGLLVGYSTKKKFASEGQSTCFLFIIKVQIVASGSAVLNKLSKIKVLALFLIKSCMSHPLSSDRGWGRSLAYAL